MTTNWKDLARATLEDSESGTMTFPQNLRILMEAGFDGYAVDFRRSTRTYYMPNGEAFELKRAPTPAPVAETFDASVVKEAIHEAQVLVVCASEQHRGLLWRRWTPRCTLTTEAGLSTVDA